LLCAFINNPWTLAPLYMCGTLLGCVLLDVPAQGLSGIEWSEGAVALWHALRPYVWPYVVGNLVLGALCAVPSYVLLRRFLERRLRA
jgi:uncharacterized protein (DUF2062 family)